MKVYICNAFSLGMLNRDDQRGTPKGYSRRTADSPGVARVPHPIDNPREFLDRWELEADADIVSAVGHADTAALFSEILGRSVTHNRVTLKVVDNEIFLVGQYTGPRLPEGVTTLPEGATIEWWVI